MKKTAELPSTKTPIPNTPTAFITYLIQGGILVMVGESCRAATDESNG